MIGDEIYEQESGLFIGNPLSSILSEIFMGSLEMSWKEESWFPRLWVRYVDDVMAILGTAESEFVLNRLNDRNPAIKFTKEEETGGEIPFLDTKLIRVNGKISIDIYRKPTDKPLCISNKSNHHPRHKKAAFESYIFRTLKFPLTDEKRSEEIKFLKEMARINEYDPVIIDEIVARQSRRISLREITTLRPMEREKMVVTNKFGKVTSQTAILPFYPPLTYKIEKILRGNKINVCYTNRGKLSNMLKNGKVKPKENERSGIYEISCQDCDAVYIGQTRRRLETRDKEHINAVQLLQRSKSSVASHCMEERHRKGEIKLKREISNPQQLDAYESLYIANEDNLMNEGDPPITSKLFKHAIVKSPL